MIPQNNPVQFRIRINHYIKVPQVRVVDAEGKLIGVLATIDALKMAKEQSLDLVEINPKTFPPICKIIDFGKYKYEEKKKQNEARKNQKASELKELTFRPNTDLGDLTHKCETAKQFLVDGNKVKFTIRFRGREVTHPEVGSDKLKWLTEQLASVTGFITPISMEGKIMNITFSPKSSN